jgi:hypothetical protein
MLVFAEVMFDLFAAMLILFLLICVYTIGEHECQEWRRRRKAKR